MLKLKVEVIDGNNLTDKYFERKFFFRVKSIDNATIHKNLIIEFRDETGKFPADDFELYKYLYGKEIGQISSNESTKMKKQYIGREFYIVAYEDGEFTGFIEGNIEHRPLRRITDSHSLANVLYD